MNRSVVVESANILSKILKRKLRNTELDGLVSYLRSLKYVDVNNLEKIVTDFSKRINDTKGYNIDIHEVLKAEIGGKTSSVYNNLECSPYFIQDKKFFRKN